MAVRITYFVHGTTTDNEKGISSGWSDVELSELGVKQSIELKDQVKDKHFDVVFCSDLKRALQEENITKPFPDGESYEDVKKRINDFLVFLKKNYEGKSVAIVSHKAPQLALDVIIKGETWEQAFREDWRKTKAWQPGWDYLFE